jgi:hypothetical protein
MCTTNIVLKACLLILLNSEACLFLRRQKCAGVTNAWGRRQRNKTSSEHCMSSAWFLKKKKVWFLCTYLLKKYVCVCVCVCDFSSVSQPYQRLAHALRQNAPGNTAPLLGALPSRACAVGRIWTVCSNFGQFFFGTLHHVSVAKMLCTITTKWAL